MPIELSAHMLRQPDRLATALLLGLLAALLNLAVLSRPWAAFINIGGPFDAPYLRGFYPREDNPTEEFRWSTGQAVLVLPGAGSLAPLELRLLGKTAGEVIDLDAGSGEVRVPMRGGWQHVRLLPRPDPWSGDVQVRIEAPTQQVGADPRQLGVVLDSISLRGGAGAPPIGQAALLGLSVALLTLLASWAGRRAWIGALAGTALAIGSATVLALAHGSWRLLLTGYTGRLAIVLLLGGALAPGVERGLAFLAARGMPAGRPGTRRALAAAVLLAFLLRFGGMAYPINVPTDLKFSLARAALVRDGKFLTLFLPNPALTPTQWNLDEPIPRSPLYYVLTAPLTWLPGEGASLALMAFSSAADALAALLVAVIVRQAGGSSRAAVYAALLAGALPLGLTLAVVWGIFPTLLAQCLALLAMAAWLHLRPRLHARRAQLLLAAAFALAYIAYPTALLFLGLTWLLLVLFLALQRDPAAMPTLRSGVLAAVLALALFYGWHIPVLVTRTLPAMFGNAADTPDRRNVITLMEVLNAIWLPLLNRFGALILGLASSAALLLASTHSGAGARAARTLLAAWLVAYVPLAFANGFVVTFILKHLLYVLPALAVLSGLTLGAFAQRRWGRVVAATTVALVLWQGLLVEVQGIVQRH